MIDVLCAMLLLIGLNFILATRSKFRIFLWLAIILVLGITYCGLYSDRVILTILIGFCYAILIIMLCINTRKHIDCCREQAAKQNGNGESPQ